MLNQLVEASAAIRLLVDVVGGLGLAAVSGAILLAIVKRNGQLRQWRHFKGDLEDWSAALLEKHDRHPKELSDDDWRAECEQMLYDARFTPSEITQIIDLAIIVAKATTHDLLDTRMQ